jgi:hypothetical protein
MIAEPPEWLVCFYDPTEPAWWAPFHRKGFGHCAAVGYLPDLRKWISVDFTRKGISVFLVGEDEMTRLFAYLMDKGRVLRVKAKGRGRFPPISPAIYCVGMVARLIGFPTWACTPFQLFCALRRSGATPMFVAPDEGVSP